MVTEGAGLQLHRVDGVLLGPKAGPQCVIGGVGPMLGTAGLMAREGRSKGVGEAGDGKGSDTVVTVAGMVDAAAGKRFCLQGGEETKEAAVTPVGDEMP
jgi:hypothetical protein